MLLFHLRRQISSLLPYPLYLKGAGFHGNHCPFPLSTCKGVLVRTRSYTFSFSLFHSSFVHPATLPVFLRSVATSLSKVWRMWPTWTRSFRAETKRSSSFFTSLPQGPFVFIFVCFLACFYSSLPPVLPLHPPTPWECSYTPCITNQIKNIKTPNLLPSLTNFTFPSPSTCTERQVA